MRLGLFALTCFALGCAKSDTRNFADSVDVSSISSTTPPGTVVPPEGDSSGPLPAEIAQWRGSSRPDKIDTLMSAAFTAEGDVTSSEDEYGFVASDSALTEIGKVAGSIPRLVECLGWDKRAHASLGGQRVLVGVICSQGILRSSYGQRIAKTTALWPANIDERSTIADFRRAQSEWIKTLRTHPPE